MRTKVSKSVGYPLPPKQMHFITMIHYRWQIYWPLHSPETILYKSVLWYFLYHNFNLIIFFCKYSPGVVFFHNLLDVFILFSILFLLASGATIHPFMDHLFHLLLLYLCFHEILHCSNKLLFKIISIYSLPYLAW